MKRSGEEWPGRSMWHNLYFSNITSHFEFLYIDRLMFLYWLIGKSGDIFITLGVVLSSSWWGGYASFSPSELLFGCRGLCQLCGWTPCAALSSTCSGGSWVCCCWGWSGYPCSCWFTHMVGGWLLLAGSSLMTTRTPLSSAAGFMPTALWWISPL